VDLPELRGRHAELAALGRLLDRIRSGMGGVVVLEGAPGMGKSRLLNEAADRARQASMRVGIGAAVQGNSAVELAPLMEALFGGSQPVLHRQALDEALPPPEQRYWVLQDIQALLERAASQSPVVVCIDDAHWADGGTATALRLLSAQLAALPIGWVIATRPNQGSPTVINALDALNDNGAEKIVLRPIERDAVTEVIRDILKAEPDDALQTMTERAIGNPFLLVELLNGLRDEQLVTVTDGRAVLAATKLPQRVRETMRRRLDRLPEGARRTAMMASALGATFTVGDLTELSGAPASAFVIPVEELVRADIFVEPGQELAFRHDLIREAVRNSYPTSARRALDRQAAAVRLTRGALPVEVASQLVESAEPGDDTAIDILWRAADALTTTAPDLAVTYSQRALEIAPPHHPLRGQLVAQIALLLHASGRHAEAKTFADTALRETLPAEQEAQVRQSISTMFALSPDVRADASRQALALTDVSPALLARHHAQLVYNLLVAGRTTEAQQELPRAQTHVADGADPTADFILAVTKGGLYYANAQFQSSLTALEGSLHSDSGAVDRDQGQVVRQWRCEVLTVLDRVSESSQLADDSIAAANHHRQQWALHLFETWRARLYLQMGRLSDAAAALDGIFPVHDDTTVVGVLDAAGIVALGRAALHIGNGTQSRHAASVARKMLEQSAPGVRRHAAWLLALQSMADGVPESAHRLLQEVLGADGAPVLPLFPMDVTDEVHMVRIALAANDTHLAEQTVLAAHRRAQDNPDVATIGAVAAHTAGLRHQSPEDLARAVDLFDDGHRPLALASALEDLGRLAIARGDTPAGTAAFDRALSLWVGSGAEWDSARVRRRLRSLGIRRRLLSAPRPRKGWAALTDSEMKVVQLIAAGQTNREASEQLFISPHTVSSHLRRAFAKLDVNSRAELARLAADQERTDG
jgi:DNA-binding CsgD family transcriptional regulator/tetratricopeptide (TPR) repeat protein